MSNTDNSVKTPKHIMEILRQRGGFEIGDTSNDTALDALPPREKLRAIVGWHLGYPEWADQFLNWAKDCGISLENPMDKPEAQ